MKRGREEDRLFAPNSKRHESIPADKFASLGIAYFQRVKEVYKDNREVPDYFCKLMLSFRDQRINIPELVSKVNALFKDHDDLLSGFRAFVPKCDAEVGDCPKRPLHFEQATDYDAQVGNRPKRPVCFEEVTDYDAEVGDRPKRPVPYEEAINYARKVKAHDEHSFQEFLKILYQYRSGNRCSFHVYEEVAQLLKNCPDLLEGFVCFLPENGVTCANRQAKTLPCTPPGVERVYKREIEDDFADDESSSDEADDPKFHPCITAKSDPGHGKKRGKEEDRDSSKEKQLDGKPNGVERTLPLRKAVNLRMHSGEGSRVVAQPTSPRLSDEEFTYSFFQKQMEFLTRVKGKLTEDSFEEILNLINMHLDDQIAGGDLDARVGDIFQDCPELIVGFNDFVSQYTIRELNFLSSIQEDNLREERDAEQQTCLREKSGKRDIDHLSSVREESGKQVNDQCTKEVELERKTEQEDESKKHSSRDLINQKSSHATNCSKYLNKPVSELDLSKCKQCTPSYRLLLEDYPLPKVGFRTCLGHAVLNDTWVSVCSGSEGYSFKQMRKNQYEETLFKCEDDRYELDMLLASLGAAIRSLEDLYDKIMNSDIKADTDIDAYLTGFAAIPSRCIERIYGDHGLDVLDLMRQNPIVALPVILNRFKQKQDEWSKCQADMNKVWAEVFAKNHQKSLDQGIFDFKQQDQKKLSTKALLAEIKEANATKRKSNDFIISIASGNSMPAIPDLKLEYPDSDIKDDLYQILEHSAKELCPNVEQLAKVLHVWKIFLEPLCHRYQESGKISKCIKSQDIVTSNDNTSLHGERTSTNAELQTFMPPMNDKVDTSRQDVFEVCALHTSETQQEAGRQCGRLIHHCRDDANQLEYSEREEREGEISPSHAPAENTLLDYVRVCRTETERRDKGASEQREEGKIAPSHAPAENTLLEYVRGGRTETEGREVDYKGANEPSAKEFDENEKACTQRFSEGSKNGESETGDNANHEDEEQRMNDGDAEETAVADGGGLVNEDRVLQRCMPLFSTGTPANTLVYYGNDNMYILLRLHQVLYERIDTAKVNAAATERKLREENDDHSFELYHKFLRALYGFLDGTEDSTKFEDACRSIGGNKFYLFLTIDKLIFKLVKQLQAVASDEMAMNLLALHAYEQSHAPGGLIDAVYQANASMLLHDENVYRFEQSEAGQLFIQLMEGSLERGEALASAMHSTFADNLSNFLRLDSLERSQKRDALFLKRNIRSCALNDDAQAGLVKDVLIVNGMELSMSCSSYKIKYIFNTEDFLYRRKCKSRKIDCVKDDKFMSKAALKFRRWLDSQM